MNKAQFLHDVIVIFGKSIHYSQDKTESHIYIQKMLLMEFKGHFNMMRQFN